ATTSPSSIVYFLFSFFLNAPAPSEIYTLSLHDALPIFRERRADRARELFGRLKRVLGRLRLGDVRQHGDGALAGRPKHVLEEVRSEEHTSELQSRENLVCRLLLEKKKKKKTTYKHTKHK